jgi:inorganic triphosphatase YgiF
VVAGSEIELKFSFAESDLPEVKTLISANAQKQSHQHLHGIYFDTPAYDLWNHGFTLRVRASGNRYHQGIKRIRSSSVTRDEWEEEISGPDPDLEGLCSSTCWHGSRPTDGNGNSLASLENQYVTLPALSSKNAWQNW